MRFIDYVRICALIAGPGRASQFWLFKFWMRDKGLFSGFRTVLFRLFNLYCRATLDRKYCYLMRDRWCRIDQYKRFIG